MVARVSPQNKFNTLWIIYQSKEGLNWFEFKDENYKKLIEAVKNIDIKENYPNIFELISETVKSFV